MNEYQGRFVSGGGRPPQVDCGFSAVDFDCLGGETCGDEAAAEVAADEGDYAEARIS